MATTHSFDLDFGPIVRMPNDKEMSVLSVRVLERAHQALRGYPSARVRSNSLRFIWHKEGDKRLIGRVDVDWRGKARPPIGRVAKDGRPMRGGNGRG